MSVWESVEFDGHEQVCYFTDPASGLRTIVAIHSTALGPAAGGTRFMAYESDALALDDALRLSRAMSYKSAIAGIPVGGGKSVIIGDPARLKSVELLHAYGRFIDRIGHDYVTGQDVGFTTEDIDTMRDVTPYAGGTEGGGNGDSAIHTAKGIIYGLEAVLKCRFQTSSFDDVRLAIQGLGGVGWRVAEALHARGAKLTVTDVRQELVGRAIDKLGASYLPPAEVHSADVDIFVPCALGGVITDETAQTIKARAVAGSANNQLATPSAGEALAANDILYAPDFVINAGGIISAMEEYYKMPGRVRFAEDPLETRLAQIKERLFDIFSRSAAEGLRPEVKAIKMAQELIGR